MGCSIKPWGKKARYYAWGHLDGNNCTWAQAREALYNVWPTEGDSILCQNGKFDVDVAMAEFDLPMPRWQAIHDTLFLLFLDDPHQLELGLKPSAERLLGMKPEEQEAVRDWLLEHQPIPGVRIGTGKQGDHYWGAYICLAPGKLVGKYADGDTIRTEALFKHLCPKTVERGMLAAYNRERKLMPILLGMDRQGVPVDLKRLRYDVEKYTAWVAHIDAWVRKTLRFKDGQEFNPQSGKQLVDALIRCKKCDPEKLGRTEKTGVYKTDKDSLLAAVTDKTLLAALKYRSQLHTCLSNFMEPWLRVAEVSDGKIFTQWNQTKMERGDGTMGTRTGRLSSTPNFQNAPKAFKPIFKDEKNPKLPACPFKGLPALPLIRSYISVPKGDVLLGRDYSQQEPRILAHFEGGELMAQYQADPWIDFHDHARSEIQRVIGVNYERKKVKTVALGLIYGQGIGSLAERIESTVEETKAVKDAILALYPGLKTMYAEMRRRMVMQEPIRTWGGREVFCEPSKFINGRTVTFDYKMVNYLIQGSAADCTKEAIIRFEAVRRPSWRLILSVHDELAVLAPAKEFRPAMKALCEAMESVEFDVKILSEGYVSKTNWAEVKDYDKKGVLV